MQFEGIVMVRERHMLEGNANTALLKINSLNNVLEGIEGGF